MSTGLESAPGFVESIDPPNMNVLLTIVLVEVPHLKQSTWLLYLTNPTKLIQCRNVKAVLGSTGTHSKQLRPNDIIPDQHLSPQPAQHS